MKAPDCLVANCGVDPKGEDAFCERHWRLLPAEYRRELVRLRNESGRGNRAAVTKFLKAAAVAAHLLASR